MFPAIVTFCLYIKIRAEVVFMVTYLIKIALPIFLPIILLILKLNILIVGFRISIIGWFFVLNVKFLGLLKGGGGISIPPIGILHPVLWGGIFPALLGDPPTSFFKNLN